MKEKAGKRKKFIAFLGTIGCGKTTASHLLLKEKIFTLFEEEFKENNFLEHFYKDMKRWAFHSQLFFLIHKLQQMESMKDLLDKSHVLQDFPIYQDILYAQLHYNLGNISKDEWELYSNLVSLHMKTIVHPDVLVYLQVSPKTALKRIKERNRSFEQTIDIHYLEQITRETELWVYTNPLQVPILTVNTETVNLIDSKRDQHYFLDRITQSLK